MRPVEASEILDLTSYERVRDEFVQRMIEYKRPRRISLGDHLTFIFENRDTVIFQIQEMTRAERTVDPDEIATEVRIYNDLVPGADELSATLMIEIPEMDRIRKELDRLIGIDERVFLEIGDTTLGATFDPKQIEAERISAVQYVKFPLGAELSRRFQDPAVRVVLRVEHPNYREAARIDGATRESLIADLQAD